MQLTTTTPGGFCPVFIGTIGGRPQQVCDGRDLHQSLQVGRDFSTWLNGRIKEYGFEEEQDFSPVLGKTPPENGRPRIDYLLSFDMAKELAMLENNEIGRAVRRYFIACEKRQHFAPQTLTPELAQTIIKALQSDAAKAAGLKLTIKGRKPGAPTRKLTPEQVIEICQSEETHAALARRFGVVSKVIMRIRAGKSYRDITGLTPTTNH